MSLESVYTEIYELYIKQSAIQLLAYGGDKIVVKGELENLMLVYQLLFGDRDVNS